MAQYYDGAKLLSIKDINGEQPEIFMCTSNRSAGKTTFFNRLVFNKYVKEYSKFCLIYRFNYELDSIAEKFFKDIRGLFFKEYEMKSEKRAKGMFHELYVKKLWQDDDAWESCGYAISLNAADQIKKYSHLLSDIDRMVFDEFQSETSHYCDNEVTKFISIHQSIARGNGEQSKHVPVYMISNPVTLLNPYYVAMDISTRLDSKTRFLRGQGFVLEQGYNESAADAQKTSAFNQAFYRSEYIEYSAEGKYLNDSSTFIEKIRGNSRYLATIKYKGKDYAIREFRELGIIYCDNRPDATHPYKISITTDDHEINYVMLRRSDLFLMQMRYFFERGAFRFKDLECKEAMLKALSY